MSNMKTVFKKTSLLVLMMVSASTLMVGCATQPLAQNTEDQMIEKRANDQVLRRDFRLDVRGPSSTPN